MITLLQQGVFFEDQFIARNLGLKNAERDFLSQKAAQLKAPSDICITVKTSISKTDGKIVRICQNAYETIKPGSINQDPMTFQISLVM